MDMARPNNVLDTFTALFRCFESLSEADLFAEQLSFGSRITAFGSVRFPSFSCIRFRQHFSFTQSVLFGTEENITDCAPKAFKIYPPEYTTMFPDKGYDVCVYMLHQNRYFAVLNTAPADHSGRAV
jgi:hypothetical protein